VFTDIPITVGTLNFSNTHTFEISGTGSLTLQGTSGTAQVIVQSGTQEIDLPTTIASNTTFNVATGATLVIAAPITIDSGDSITQTGGGTVTYQSIVNVQSGASVAFGSSATINALNISSDSKASVRSGTGSVLKVSNLSMSGTLDLADNALEVDYGGGGSPIDGIKAEIYAGYNRGLWNGIGITSSAARADPSKYGIGYADGNLDFGTAAQPGEIIVKFALLGDTNLDGTVDFGDLLTVADHYGTTNNDWADGNFTYDPSGLVDVEDLLALAQNYQEPLTADQAAQLPAAFVSEWTLAQSEVPEPTSAAMILAGSCLLLARRRHTGV
ncbi:MAG: PEP-CTERM sorting domain-containing protein, partial [Tepidisphaeraceae bacterium]